MPTSGLSSRPLRVAARGRLIRCLLPCTTLPMARAMSTVAHLRSELASGRTTSRALVDEALAKIEDPSGEGSRAYMKVYADLARAEADASDKLRAAGVVRSPVEGLPISVKDLFDVAGDVTLAGSKALASQAPAERDAPVIAKLRAAGAVILGRTAMTEFAFGGVGTNPHYGTPRSPYGRDDGSGGRVPGGSSSGAGVAVADGLCVMGLGTDTRGSVRIPSALCGVTGFKPTASRVDKSGAFPLSYTLDSVGPLANSVECCAIFDAILSGERPAAEASAPEPLPLRGLRLLLPSPSCFVMKDLDAAVTKAFDRAVSALESAGAMVTVREAPCFDAAHALYESGGFAGPESFQIHRETLEAHGELYDPNVAARIRLGAELKAADYVQRGIDRARIIGESAALLAGFDAMIMPTVACIPPTIADCESSMETYAQYNLLLLRNTGLINMLDGCAASLPCHTNGEPPVGLMVAGLAGEDKHVLAAARAVEGALADALAIN